MSLVEQVSAGIMEAMKAKNTDRLRALRSIKSAFLLLKSAEGVGEVTDELCIKSLQKMAKQRKDSLDIYIEQGREDLAVIEHSELAIINGFLPTQLGQAEIEAQVKLLISETGSLTMKDLGKVMPLAMKSMGGLADGKLISAAVKKLLS
ncbi:MAG: glutamyl-tRNA amidotransferase [Flavobacteriales bacterium]|nr:GatB/YqeY domain-containing protein [Flavobacteriaceae bacterium]PHX93134.1 MAG: glutamyl-tRNA amidotransferase [Flavobacteriales bacterium]